MATVRQQSPIDLTGKSQAAFPIRLGASILKPSDATHFASIRYNHRPALKQTGDVKATIGHGIEGNELLLEAEAGQYTYRGKYAQDEESFVLVLRGEGKERKMVLERLDGTHAFNLISTPTESDATKLEQRHPHLTDAPGEDDLFGDDDEDLPPDESNPFDYRHFLKAELEKPEPSLSANAPSRSTFGTPIVQPAARSTTVKPPAKPAPKAKAPAKRKTAAEKVSTKRVKAGQEPVAESQPAKTQTTKSKPDIPKVRVDRKAPVRKPSVDDGELILENENPVTEKPPRAAGAMAWALNGALSTGPISLASAASSPGVVSPAPEREEEEQVQEYEFDFGDGSDAEDEQDDSELVLENGGGDDDDGELVLEDDDADVDEHLELPSPAQTHRPTTSAAHVPPEEDDDDMEKQLALAMAADDEEEESEEE
ncbi:putative transcription elongation factor Eaf [Septoria linicola]|nr:putative transcription elongation factor Eaf [Septoria linicola]